MPHGFPSCRLGPPLLAALLAAGSVQAQIVTDGSVGPRESLSGPQVEIGATLGTQTGANLFHSFERFGIAPGQTAVLCSSRHQSRVGYGNAKRVGATG